MAGTVWSVGILTGYEGVMPTPDDLGCKVFVTSTDGWRTAAAPRVDQVDKPYTDGTSDGRPTQPGRAVTIAGTCKAPNELTLLAWMDRFTSLLSAGDRYDMLTVTEPHLTRYSRVRRGAEAIAVPTGPLECSFSAILYAPEPRRFGDPLPASTGLPSVTGGLTVPYTVPFAINSNVVSGEVDLTSPGYAPGPVRWRVDGPPNVGDPPLVAPVVTHSSSVGQATWASSLRLSSGEFLIIDMDNDFGSVLAQGQEPRDGNTTQRGWSQFDPGGNVWAFTATSGSGLLTVIATPAWP